MNEHPEEFYYYNNGITITCIEYNKIGKNKVKLITPQVINGAQTLNSIYKTYIENENSKSKGKDKGDNHYEKIKVLAMLIEVPKNENDFVKNITTYRNANNPIRLSDYKGNCPIQENIQKEMYKLGYFYMIKRGEDKEYLKVNDEPIKHNVIDNFKYEEKLKNNFKTLKLKIEHIATIMTAYNGDPVLAKQSPSSIFANDDNYKKVFLNSIAELYGIVVQDEELVEDNQVIKYLMRSFPVSNQFASYLPMFYPEMAKDLGIRMQSQYGLR